MGLLFIIYLESRHCVRGARVPLNSAFALFEEEGPSMKAPAALEAAPPDKRKGGASPFMESARGARSRGTLALPMLRRSKKGLSWNGWGGWI